MKQVAPLFQNDIQGLRGLAVVLVIAFHIFPALVPGGFIGVDVFFVISGYLITSHLLKELAKTGSIDVTEFYFRRLARLVPGASLLLVAFSFFTIWVLPVTRWRDAGIDIFGSAAYVENWVLMRRSVNYLNAWSAPSIAQHFWSLSVEGQFYLLWPLLLLAVYWLARRSRIEFVFWSIFIPLIAALLFIFSVVVFSHNPGLAYFSTSTRIWELVLGGAVAVLVRFDLRPGKFAAEALGAAALASIVGAAFLFDHSTPYPKYAALVPTLGSAVLLFVGSNGTSLSNRWLALPVLTYIGDISYAVYLWHWPLLIFAGYSFEPPLGNWTKLALVGMTCLFAHLSTFYVELPARRMIAALKDRLLLRTAYVAGAMCMCMAFGLGILGYTKYLRYQAANTALDHSIFIGARATEAASIPPAASFRPAPIAARDDRQEECLASYTDTVPRPCQYGAKDNRFRIALVGDSHAMQWLPTLLEIESTYDVSVIVLTKAMCSFASTTFVLGQESRTYSECSVWNENVTSELKKLNPDLVLTSSVNGYALPDENDVSKINARVAKAFVDAWKPLVDGGMRIAAIKDTAFMPFDVPECLARNRSDPARCSAPSSAAFKAQESIVAATKALPQVELIDMEPWMCPHKVCLSVIGNVMVYRDSNHISATYARSLAPYLAEALKLPRRQTSGIAVGHNG